MGSLMSFFGGLCGKKKSAGECIHTHTHPDVSALLCINLRPFSCRVGETFAR